MFRDLFSIKKRKEEEMNGFVFIDEEGQNDSMAVEESQMPAEPADSTANKESATSINQKGKTNIKVKTN